MYHFAIKVADEWPHYSEISNDSTAGPGLVRLTHSRGSKWGASHPAWSPNDQTIAFDWHLRTKRGTAIYLVPATGGAPVQITGNDDWAEYPFWSADGALLGFDGLVGSSSKWAIWTMDPAFGAQPLLRVSQQGEMYEADLAPDGSRLVYSAGYGPGIDIQSHIYVVPAFGGVSERLVSGDPDEFNPRWSPDGSMVVFSSERAGNFDIWVVPASGGEPARLTHDLAYESSPVWSPDGATIAFDRSAAYRSDLWLMSSDGGNPVQLTSGDIFADDPSWSPDGQQIAFTSREDGIRDIWVLTLE